MASKSKGGVSFVVQSKLKELVKKSKMKCSSDVVMAMNKMINTTVTKGVERAKGNGRKTLRAVDL